MGREFPSGQFFVPARVVGALLEFFCLVGREVPTWALFCLLGRVFLPVFHQRLFLFSLLCLLGCTFPEWTVFFCYLAYFFFAFWVVSTPLGRLSLIVIVVFELVWYCVENFHSQL